MKRRLLTHLVCPIDRTPLELIAWDTVERSLGSSDRERAQRAGIAEEDLIQETITGVLVNRSRRIYYPIHRGVPRLLPYETGVGKAFVEAHRPRLERELSGFTLPSAPSAPGEREVLRTFSSEWVEYDWDASAYWSLSPEAWFKCMRYILGFDEHPVTNGLVLEVGIGIGGVADHVATTQGSEVVGIDLSHAVDPAYEHFGANPFLHIAQASAFAPPFPEARFDFVYSFGVLHHTYSTQAAFQSIARLPKKRGRLYVWVYSHHDEERTLVRRALMTAERLVRPVASRLPDRLQAIALAPIVPFYIGYQALRVLRAEKGQVHYGWREAMHAARDRFTPRYVHRHTDEEVCQWFQRAGYDDLQCTSKRPRPDFVPEPFVACAGVEGIRTS